MKYQGHMEYAKPFLKWAGGKRQLLDVIESNLPGEINKWKSFTYIEPFVGSGAMLFGMLKKFPNLRQAVINDINPDLTKSYAIIKNSPKELINKLKLLQHAYYRLKNEEEKKHFFLVQREKFNTRNLTDIENTSLFIFLNRTCFNGLYRVNSKGTFNVPFGKYLNPKICDEKTILADSAALQKVKILNGDFEKTISYAGGNTVFYFDPPYKPISVSSRFTAYSTHGFDDKSQERLKKFCDLVNKKGYHFILSNSDLKNHDTENNYFDDLYAGYTIGRVEASRTINSVVSKRGKINELLITNNDSRISV